MRQAIRAAGEVLLTVGLVGLLFIGYLIWGTGLRAASAQRALSSELNQQWQRPGGRGDAVGARAEQFDVATGQPFAFLKIPAERHLITPRSAHVRLALAPAARPHPARVGVLALIILAVTTALWFYVFPWASLHPPIDSSGFNG